jgi:DNA excision repair protein ERCC-2
MALTLSKQFMRRISQSSHLGANDVQQTGVSLWTIEDVLRAQEKQKRELAEAEEAEMLRKAQEEIQYGDGGIDDDVLMELDLE